MIQVLALLIGGYGLILVGLTVFQRNLLFHPDTSLPSPAPSGVGEMLAVTIQSRDGLTLSSWYAEGDAGRPVIVYFHGNAGHIGSRGHKVRPFLDAGFGVLLVGYRGYGGNPGNPTEAGLYTDARDALDWLDKKTSNRPIVLYGESLGTAIATTMAAERAVAGKTVQALILEAPFTSVTDAAQHHYPYVPVKWLLKDHFEQASRIDDVSAPVLVLHGEKDQTMPIRFGKGLFEQAVMPKVGKWYDEAGHNDLFDYGAGDFSVEFINQYVAATP